MGLVCVERELSKCELILGGLCRWMLVIVHSAQSSCATFRTVQSIALQPSSLSIYEAISGHPAIPNRSLASTGRVRL